MDRAQAAVEYLVLTSTALVIIAVIFYSFRVASRSFSNEIRVSQLQNSVNVLVDASNIVCLQGEPAAVIREIYIPPGVISAWFEGSKNETIFYNLTVDSHFTSVSASSLCSLNGSLPIGEGIHKVLIEAKGGYVNITSL